ncbi:pectate lyase [Draconibacterium sp.]|nr:pectate lyase [Draconibacterium sp.]
MKKHILIALVLIITFATSWSQQLAFPTAEGYGKYTVGGRGGAVYEVTNLNDSGEGSFRAAVEAAGARTVVFRISGTINLKSDLRIKNPNITIAGQTAPGDGITLRGRPLLIDADEVIIRYIRVRLGDESKDYTDAVTSRYTNNLILDHVSASWSIDETLTVYHGKNATVQWCVISESLYESNHWKGNHGYGGIWGSNYSSFHHNLIANHSNRNPRFASGCGNVDYRNNVVYNWGYASTYGAEMAQLSNPDKFYFSNINMVANYYKPGPATQPGEVTHCLAAPWSRNGDSDYGKWYIADNVMIGSEEVTNDNWKGVVPSLTAIKGVQEHNPNNLDGIPGLKLDKPWPAMAIRQETAEEAYASVLENAGTTLPKRDAVDLRIIDEVRFGYATYEGTTYKKEHEVADKSKICGIIDSHKDVGGWPELKSLPAPTDTDHDGMPNSWETKNNLNPKDASDRNKVGADGYTMLEKYLNSIQ